MDIITEELPNSDENEEVSHGRNQDAKAERRRQQKGRYNINNGWEEGAEHLAQREGWEQAQRTAEKDFVRSTQSPILDFTVLIMSTQEPREKNGEVSGQCYLLIRISIIIRRPSNPQHIRATVEISRPITI
ncbi:hypothetical protein PENANT_c015G06977 [Penicillium antarcticum]|uniref:Uncharacterized protein n=1 Tax=Penicillium antarcticum TaxID=416450 RepID=A0A1V6Q4Q7_9EURO|nr:hypothetical protein PENANT_c015G06977 [Penicillium antarcticum]